MLSGEYRFHSRGGVRYVQKNGKSVRGPKISLVYLGENKRKRSRFAVVVSKKVLKSAVGRNRIRRRIYEVIRMEFPNMKEMIDVVVSVYSKDIELMPHGELTGIMRDTFRSADLYKN